MNLKLFFTLFFLFIYKSVYGISSNTDFFEETKVKIILGKKQEKVIDIGLDFSIAKGWKIYWIYPGDSGLPPELKLTNLKEYTSLTPSWPFPHEEYDESIGLTSRIYKNNVTIPYKLILEDKILQSKELEFDLEYQICEEICIPVSTKLFLSIPKTDYYNKKNMQKIEAHIRKVPIATNFSNNQIYITKKEKNKIIVDLKKLNSLDLKKNNVNAILYNKNFPTLRTTRVENNKNNLSFTLESEEELFIKNEKATIFLKLGDNYIFSKVNINELPSNLYSNNLNLYIVLITAFFAGFILNFMPCVFPVLGIKINNLLKQVDTRNKRIVVFSSLYVSLGIISMFVIFALVAIFLRSIGMNLGWGMQFQSPYFLIFLICLLLLFTIITFDLIKINFIQKYMQIGFLEKQIFKKNIFISNFFTGVLSTLLATPCTAPLVGTAISFALSQNYFLSILVFFLMGIGKSLPYLIFIIKPNILWYFPKPGVWTKYIKFFIGLLLIISLVWLISLLLQHYSGSKNNINNTTQVLSNWEEYDEGKLISYIKNKEKVFIDVTAEWCLNCKVNKKLVLENKEVLEAFNQNNVKLMRADWTFPDENIFYFLKKYNRYGIPFNIFFSENNINGYIFSEILNKNKLIKILSD